MADRYWVGASTGATGNWNTTASWSTSSGGGSGASVPGSSDNAIFDGAGGFVGGCVVNAAISIINLTLSSGYTGASANDGHFDNATNDQSIAISGNCVCDNKQVSMGDATWTVGGNWDNADVATFNRNVSTVVMTGTSKTLTVGTSNDLLHLTISGSVTVVTGSHDFLGTLTVNGTLTFTGILRVGGGGTGTLAGNGTINAGTDSIDLVNAGVTINWSGFTGTFNGTSQSFPNKNVTLGGCTMTCDVAFSKTSTNARTITLASGTTLFGDITFTITNATNGLTVANNTNNPNLEFVGNVTLTETAGTITWTKGTGTITFSGTADQDIDFAGKTIEDIEIDKSAGTLTLTDNLTTDSLTLTDGTLDVDGNTLTSSGAVSGAAGFVVQDTAGGGEIVCTDINYSGTSWDDAALSASGSTRAFHDCTITGSDASGSAGAIDATDGCVDGTGNTNYTFAVPSGIALQMQHYQRTYGGVLSV